MGVTVLPTDYGGANQTIASIAGNVAQLVNPFHHLQMEVRNRIAMDPELAQHLSDLEDASPGTLQTMGLGKVGDMISKVPPSQAQTIKKATDARLKASAEGAGGNDAVSRQLTGENVAQYQNQQAGAVVSGAQAQGVQNLFATAGQNGNPSLSDIQNAVGTAALTHGRMDELEQGIAMSHGYQNAEAMRGDLQNTDWNPIISGAAHNSLTPAQNAKLSAGLMLPDMKTELQDRLNFARSKASTDNMVEKYGLMGQMQQNDIFARQAASTATSDGRVDLVKPMYNYLTDNSISKRVDDLRNGRGQPQQPGEEQLGQLGQYLNQKGAAEFNTQRTGDSKQLQSLVNEATDTQHPPTQARLQVLRDEINDVSQRESSFSGLPTIQAKLDNSGWLGIHSGDSTHISFTAGGQPIGLNDIQGRAQDMGLGVNASVPTRINSLPPNLKAIALRTQQLQGAQNQLAGLHKALTQGLSPADMQTVARAMGLQ